MILLIEQCTHLDTLGLLIGLVEVGSVDLNLRGKKETGWVIVFLGQVFTGIRLVAMLKVTVHCYDHVRFH